MDSGWLTTVLPAKQMLDLKLFFFLTNDLLHL